MQLVYSGPGPRYRKNDSSSAKKILAELANLAIPESAAPCGKPKAGAADGMNGKTGPSFENTSAMRVDESRKFMERHLHEPLKVPRLASQAGVSTSQFFKLFKENTGSAPVAYFTRLKLKYACHWLATTNWSVKEIAVKLGYVDPLYFSRVFRAVMGTGPKAYRGSKMSGN
ncbi:MAG: AraC family transcriptional regulator [Limisphaerales bacterium]